MLKAIVQSYERLAKFLDASRFAIERHVQLMMVAHAYLEIERQDALAAASDPDARVTLGDIQRQHQMLSRRAEIAQVFDLSQRGFKLDYQRLAA